MITRIGIPESKSNNRISGLGIIESFWVSVWLGRFKFNLTAVVRLDEVLKAILVGNLWLLEQPLVVLLLSKKIEDLLNDRLRKKLEYQTPNEVFFIKINEYFVIQFKLLTYV